MALQQVLPLFFIGSVAALSFLIHIIIHSPISPIPLLLPPPSHFTPNNILQTVDRIGEGFLEAPEDVCVGGDGLMYTATRDGWIKRMHQNGTWENWKFIGGRSLLGITASRAGGLLVCDANKGLLKVSEEGVTLLTSEVEGTKIRFADDVIEASDGIVYFSDASTKFGFDDSFLDLLEAKPHGRLLKFNLLNNKTSILADNLYFANGVALSSNEEFLIVCETWRFRCLKYWLKGEKIGKTEVFIDNLSGGPDNINLAPDGSFWISLVELRGKVLNLAHGSPLVKRVLATFPKLHPHITTSGTRAMVVNVAVDGKIVRIFDDSNGKVMSLVTSAIEFQDHLYLGSLKTNFIGRLSLNVVFGWR